ncbi:enoyl-CoA hydratase-related protein [Nocardia sp. NPDC005366]|uniref:enoyl-CoA hydratase-related protein n=1 Tax=Nocardia sp. NPDC005366 TaxID=3156878 RepID=UPI00339DFD54
MRDGVTVVTLNRPARLNALETAYGRALRRARVDQHVRVVVVTGSGDAFYAGADTAVLDAIDSAGGTKGVLDSRSRYLRSLCLARFHGRASRLR